MSRLTYSELISEGLESPTPRLVWKCPVNLASSPAVGKRVVDFELPDGRVLHTLIRVEVIGRA